jgi:hypothetical protein
MIKPKRWYDRQPKLAQAVRLMFLFPVDIKSLICDGLMIIANREFQVSEKLNSFKTLGPDKVLGMHKSKNKRREYDRHDVLHKAMNYMYVLSHEGQDCMADHILELVNFIHQYLSTCQAFKSEPTLDDIAEIVQVYVQKGGPETEKFINRLRQQFQILKREDEEPVDFLEFEVMDQQMLGMKIVRGAG